VNSNDPFFPSGGDSDRTVIKPVPGGKSSERSPPSRPPPPSGPPGPPGGGPPRGGSGPGLEELGRGPGINPLEAAGTHLFTLAAGLRNITRKPDLPALRDRIVRQLKQFQRDAQAAGYEDDTVRRAHYTLCAMLDEMVLGTPWGSQSRWQEHSLLSTFHRETWGGEQVFNIIEKAKRNAGKNRDLLEFLYVVLALGFEGAYGAAPDGRERLAQVRESLFQTIRNQRPETERDLSLRWQGSRAGKPGLTGFIPPWAIAAIGAGLLLVVFIGFSLTLNRSSDPLMARIYALDGEALARLEQPERPPTRVTESAAVTLEQLLESDITAERVVLERDARNVTLRLAGDGLFASGSSRVESDLVPVIERIGQALAQVPGKVRVTGHSDNVPMFSARYPSNWHLSEARAESVARILKEPVGEAERFTYEGRADTQPLATNETADGRARNRRVEISLLAEGDEDA